MPEAHDLLPSHIATSGALSTGLLVNTNLDISVPDTYQPPPPPIPYETYIGRPQTRSGNPEGSGHSSEVALETSNAVSVEGTNAGRTFETKVKNLVPDGKAEISSELEASKEMEDERSDELKKSSKPVIPPLQDDDDICPICLEGATKINYLLMFNFLLCFLFSSFLFLFFPGISA